MAPGSQSKEGRGRSLRSFSFNDIPVEAVIFTSLFLLSWQSGSLPFFNCGVPKEPANCPQANGVAGFKGPGAAAAAAAGAWAGDFDMEAHKAKLVRQIRLNAPVHLVERCVGMVLGTQWWFVEDGLNTTFSQAYQDWVMYHTFYSRMEYGEGFYLDVGANHPIIGSNTYFYDVCLGWRGICMEPNPMYVEPFQNNRTCIHVKNCVGPVEAELTLSADQGSKGQVKAGGEGIKVLCRPLQDVLVDLKVGMTQKGQQRIDFASLDIEGFEHSSFRCFPFDLFDIPVWLIELKHQKGWALSRMMERAGYWTSPQIIIHWVEQARPAQGYYFDNLFVRWTRPTWMYASITTAAAAAAAAGDLNTTQAGGTPPHTMPPLVLGPDFLPGGVLEGESFLPPCAGADCPQQVPAVEDKLEYKGGEFDSGECKAYRGVKHRLSSPGSG